MRNQSRSSRGSAAGTGRGMFVRGVAVIAAAVLAAIGALFVAHAQRASASAPPSDTAAADAGLHIGKSGLPLPRFVSLKAGRVNVRVGPGEDYKVAWVFTRSALPVEIIQEFDTWRRIRDSDGQVGWVFQSLLSGKRTAVVSPWKSNDPLPVRSNATDAARVTAMLQPGVQASIDRCHDGWCEISGKRFSGWIEQTHLWGVYPGETVN